MKRETEESKRNETGETGSPTIRPLPPDGDDQRGPASGRAPKGLACTVPPSDAVNIKHVYTEGQKHSAEGPEPGRKGLNNGGRKRPSGKRFKRAVFEVVEPTLNVQQTLRGPLLDARRERFCQALLTEATATGAALRAGYAPASARNQASRLLTNDDIQRRLAGLFTNTQGRSILRRRDVLRNASQRAQGTMVDIGPLLGLRWDLFVEAIKHHPAGKAIRKIKMGVKFDREANGGKGGFSEPFVQEVELFNPRDAERLLADLLGWDAPRRVELEGTQGGGVVILPAPVAPTIGELPSAGTAAAREGEAEA